MQDAALETGAPYDSAFVPLLHRGRVGAVYARFESLDLRRLFANSRRDIFKTINSIVVFVTCHFSEPQRVVVTPPKTAPGLTCHHKIAPHEGRLGEKKNMSTVHPTLTTEKEAEAAVAEFLEMRAAILGRLSPEALRCVAAIFERRMEEKREKKNSRF